MSNITIMDNELLLKEYFTSCFSLKEIIEKFGLCSNGSSNYILLKNLLRKYGIDISLIKSKSYRKRIDKLSKSKQGNDSEIFCENSYTARSVIRRIIIRRNLIEYKCFKCNNNGVWLGDKLSLQLEHKNGLSNDHRIDNLVWLCPNCHSQTKTFSGKNKNTASYTSTAEVASTFIT